jgi:peptidoglycan/LPS O-acetylase OafA/YrhL
MSLEKDVSMSHEYAPQSGAIDLRGDALVVTDRYESIQVLRALAAVAVVMLHSESNAGAYGWFSQLFPPIARYGLLGVDVFFVVSGFVMALVSYGEPQGLSSARKFMANRVARIVPLYWVLTALFVTLLTFMPAAFGHARIDLWHVITSFIFVPSINWAGEPLPILVVGWTLNYEMWFYLAFAVAIYKTKRPVITTGIFLGLTSLLGLTHSSGTLFRFYTNPIVLEFVAGGFLGAYYAKGGRIPPGFALAVLSGIIVLETMYAPALTDGNRFIVFGLPALAIVCVALALEARIRWSRRLTKLGDASYALYLTHVFTIPIALKVIQMADPQHGLPGDVICATLVIGSISGAFACHYLLERPMTRWARRWLKARY